MEKILAVNLLLLALCLVVNGQSARDKAVRLAEQMSLAEKIALVHGVGNGWGEANYAGRVPRNAQRGIPQINLEDGPQGVADNVGSVTCWPSSIAVAAAWDEALMYDWAAAMAKEQYGKGTNVMLGPDINIARVPMGGRVFETFGEDPYLSGRLVGPNVKGIQSQKVVANAKHYINNDQENNRDYVSVQVDERTNFEVYYWPFQESVDAGVGSVMCSYNKINGTYACENDQALRIDLKQRMGFTGFVVSDWGGTHSTVLAANSGLDMQQPDAAYFGTPLQTAVNNGQVNQARLTDMVVRILTPLYALGIMDNPNPTGSLTSDVRSTDHNNLARKLASAGVVLLKNSKDILPLPSTIKRIALIGDPARDNPTIGGDASGGIVKGSYTVTPLQGIQNRAGSGVTITYDNTRSTNAATNAKAADVAIVFVAVVSKEGQDRSDLTLPNNQDNLIRTVVAAQPNTIVVIYTPGAVLTPWADSVPAILVGWFGGQEIGNGIAAVLFGDVNPAGKLPVTFPVAQNDWYSGSTQQYPGTGNVVQYTEKLLVGYRWYDSKNITPRFPFGHGLSYTTFNYSNLVITKGSPNITVTVDITNSGKVAGTEIPQLYLAFPASAGEPPKILRGFQKVTLNAGARTTARFALRSRDVSIWSVERSGWTAVTGTFGVQVGSSSRDIRLTGSFTV